MNKKIIPILLLIVFVMASSVPVFAGSQEVTSETIYYDDGTYAVVTTTVDNSFLRASVKDGSKTHHHYDANDTLLFSFTVKGTFSYDNSQAEAISSSCSSKVYQGWQCDSKSSRCSGASVIGEATFSLNGVERDVTLTLTCSPSGAIS